MLRVIGIVAIVLAMGLSEVLAAEKIVMTCQFSNEREILGKWVELIYTDAFQRIGMAMELKYYPIKRGDALVMTGDVAGILSRPANYAALYPDLVMVAEPAPIDKLAVLATDANLTITDWESLKSITTTIEYPRGFVLVEKNLPNVVKAEQIVPSDDLQQSLKKLAAGRIGLLIAPDSILAQLLNLEEFKNSGIHKVGEVAEVPLHAFFHPTHKDLAPKLAEALKQVKAEGLIDQYRKTAEEATSNVK